MNRAGPRPAIAPAAPSDAVEMAGILCDWVDETPWMPNLHTEADTIALCEGLVPVTTVALRSGRPVGFLSRRGSEVLTLFLAPSERGRGTGQCLLDAAKAECERLSLWTFAANDRARAFYAREGFAEIGGTDGDNDEGLPDVRLEWSRP